MKAASTAPTHCSSCFAQQPDELHIDFESAWDGPTFREGVAAGDGSDRVVATIDDLVICKQCVLEAAALVHQVEPDDRDEKIAHLEAELQTLREEKKGLELHNQDLSRALDSQPEPAGGRGARRAAA